MTRPNCSIDPCFVGHVFTHMTIDGFGERVFDRELALDLCDVIVLQDHEGDHYFEVTQREQVVIDSHRAVGDVARYSAFVLFLKCEAIPLPMPAGDAPLSPPSGKTRKHKEKP